MKNKIIRPYQLRHAAALCTLALAAGKAHAVNYTFSDLGTITGPDSIYAGANGINNSGQVVGYVTAANVPTLWDGNTRSPLGLLAGGSAGIGIHINDNGQTVGWNLVGADTVPVRWDGTSVTALDTLAPGFSIAWSNNNTGQAAGFGLSTDGNIHGIGWSGTTATDLGGLGGTQTLAFGINASGQIVGDSHTEGDNADHAVLWSNSILTDLGTLGGNNSSAKDINDSGQIVGNSVISDGLTTHAAYWNSSTAAPADLGSLGGDSFANAINAIGQIVGFSYTADGSRRASLWNAEGIHDLNLFLPADLAASGWNLYTATAINDNGVIIGFASSGPNPSASQLGVFMLTPTAVPVPAAVWLLGSALVGMGIIGRRQTGSVA